MLADAQPTGFIAVGDFDRARAFYEGVLGLEVVSQDQFALVMKSGPIHIRLAIPPERVTAAYTIFGWAVPDADETVTALSARGVTFERFPFFGDAQGPNGVWSPPGGGKVAWFKDPDGNLLSVSSDP